MTTKRVFNFSAGPAVLPETVLQKVADELVSMPGVGSSILEVSHRGPVFTEYLNRARDGLRELLQIPAEYEILFLQGGSRLQFAMVPINFQKRNGKKAAYLVSGSWGQQAFQEAKQQGDAEKIWSGESSGFSALPDVSFDLESEAYNYFYFVSNETIQGVQFREEPDVGEIPLICDASSDFLHKPLDVSKYGMIYACAQKNAGPAGLTIVVARRDLIDQANKDLPGYLDYRSHADNGSLFNTPPTFGIYVFALIVEWLRDDIGGLERMYELNRKKAELVYSVIDQYRSTYIGHAREDCRSLMNVVFRFADEQQQDRFVEQAKQRGLVALAGHRSVGGIRASLYNAMPLAGAQALADFMTEFAEQG